MSEFFLCEIENIEKSGVEIKVTGARFKKDDDNDCIRTVRTVCFDFSEHDKVFEDKIAELKKDYKTVSGLLSTYQQENESLKQRIAELESKESEVCENEPKISDSAPSREWYENRHQSDCIEINRLNTTIDVLIHKVEYLRQFAGLE